MKKLLGILVLGFYRKTCNRLVTGPTKSPNLVSVYLISHYQFQSLNMSRLDSLLIGPHWTSRLYFFEYFFNKSNLNSLSFKINNLSFIMIYDYLYIILKYMGVLFRTVNHGNY